jgi:signal transduction histidine kinase
MPTVPAATAFEAEGCRALARLGGRMTFLYGLATVLGLLAGAGRHGVLVALEILLLAAAAVPAVGFAGMLLPGHGRHAVPLLAWPRSHRLRRVAPALLVAVATGCGLAVLHQVCALVAVLGWPRVHLLAGWVIPGFGLGLTLAAGPLWGVLSFAVLVAGFRLLVLPAGAPGVPVTAAGAAVTVVVGMVVHLAARQGFRSTELAARAAEDAEAARLAAEQRLLARRRTDRTLHDTVLATLTLLAHAGVGVPADEVRSACRRDLELLRGTGDAAEPAGPRERVIDLTATATRVRAAGVGALVEPLGEVRALAARRGLDLRIHGQAAGSVADGVPDPGALQAWSGALAECVVNIARHAHVAAADVVVGLAGDTLVTVVVDEGVGFDPGAVAPERLGLSGSVRERLAEVGGDARVWSRPGQGTVVQLFLPWPRGVAAARPDGPLGPREREAR